MVITTTFDKTGDHVETIETPEVKPYEIFKKNIKIKSLRIKFMDGETLSSQLSFYRTDFSVAQ